MPKTILPAFGQLKAHAVSSRLTNKYPHKGMIRGFHNFTEAWYAEANRVNGRDIDEVNIGFFATVGEEGTTGEFSVSWEVLGGKSIPCLRVYGDAWEALAHFSDLLAEMAKIADDNLTPAEFCKILRGLQIKDLTARERR